MFKKIKKRLNVIYDKFRGISLKRKVFALATLFTVMVMIWFVGSLLVVSEAEIELAKLKYSYENEKICHEECYRKRYMSERRIIEEIKKDKGLQVLKLIEKYFENEDTGREFKQEILKIVAASNLEESPRFVKDYLTAENVDPVLYSGIIKLFKGQSLLPKDSEISPTDLYFSIIESPSELVIKLAAIKAFTNYSRENDRFMQEDLAVMKKLIFSPQIEDRVQQELFLAIGDYYETYPIETAAIFKTIYDSSESSEISRALAADILNNKAGENLPIPDIGEAQWAQYFDN